MASRSWLSTWEGNFSNPNEESSFLLYRASLDHVRLQRGGKIDMEPHETYGSKGHYILETTEKLGYIRVGTICDSLVNGFALGILLLAGFTYERA